MVKPILQSIKQTEIKLAIKNKDIDEFVDQPEIAEYLNRNIANTQLVITLPHCNSKSSLDPSEQSNQTKLDRRFI